MHLSHLGMSTINIAVWCKSRYYIHTQPFLLSHNCGISNIPSVASAAKTHDTSLAVSYLLLKN